MRRARRRHSLTRALRRLLPRTRIRARYRVIVGNVKRAARNARRRGRHLISTRRMRRLGRLLGGGGASASRTSSGNKRGLFGFSVAGGERVDSVGARTSTSTSTRGRDSVDSAPRRYEAARPSRQQHGSGPAQVLQPSDLKGLVAPALLAN